MCVRMSVCETCVFVCPHVCSQLTKTVYWESHIIQLMNMHIAKGLLFHLRTIYYTQPLNYNVQTGYEVCINICSQHM